MKFTRPIVPSASKQLYGQRDFLYAWIGLLLLLLWTPSAIAAIELEGMEYSSLPDKQVRLKFELSKPIPEPKSFAIDNPAYIVLDFPGVKIGSMPRSQAIGIGMTRSVTLVEAEGRLRAVINLVQSTPFEVEVEGNAVYVTVSGSPANAPVRSEMAAYPEQHFIKDIDFRRAEQGAGRVIVSLSNARMPIDIREEGGRILVNFIDATLPPELERRLDVLDFATPVKFIDTFATDRGVRMTIIPTSEEYEHLSYQSEDTLVVELKPLNRAQKGQANKNELGYTGEKLSLNFQNIGVRAVLQQIADFVGFNLVAGDTVQGNITLRLQNVPWDQALDIILKQKGLGMRRSDNVILVAPREKIAAREKSELEARSRVEQLAPLHSEFIRVNFAQAGDLAELIKAEENSLLSPRGNVAVDDRTNTLLVRDTAERLVEIRKLAARLDIPVQQVLIEARVVIASRDFSKDLGIRFGLNKRDSTGGALDQVVTSGSLGGTTQILNKEGLDLGDRLNVNLPVTKEDAARLALAFTTLPLGALLELELSALQAEGRGEIISNPRIITSNQQEAVIKQGTQIPYQQSAGGASGATTVSFKDAVLSLEVTPQITPDGGIIMDLVVTKDAVGRIFNGVPSIDTRQISTQVLVDNGQTIVLGGIYEQEQNQAIRRVPFLGELPYVGALFRTKSEISNKRELLIFVTPKIIKERVQL